jgi:hypothetical protein
MNNKTFSSSHSILDTDMTDNFAQLLPLAAEWVGQQERSILQRGEALTPAQLTDAVRIGVAHPEQVRVLPARAIPLPQHPALAPAAAAIGLLDPQTPGLTLRYGIFIRAEFWGNRATLVQALVHTAQYEQLGCVQAFLERYCREVLTMGYARAPMVQAARWMTWTILAQE